MLPNTFLDEDINILGASPPDSLFVLTQMHACELADDFHGEVWVRAGGAIFVLFQIFLFGVGIEVKFETLVDEFLS